MWAVNFLTRKDWGAIDVLSMMYCAVMFSRDQYLWGVLVLFGGVLLTHLIRYWSERHA